MARNSLADQLAELGSAAPRDDIEDDVDALDAGRRTGSRRSNGKYADGPGIDAESAGDDSEDEARSHARHTIVDVGPSKMRRRANLMEGFDGSTSGDKGGLLASKYANGVTTTRQQMLHRSDDEEDDASSIGSIESQDDDDEEDDEGSLSGSALDDVDESAGSISDDDEDEDDLDKMVFGSESGDSNADFDLSESKIRSKSDATTKKLRFADDEELDDNSRAGPSSPRSTIKAKPKTAAEADAAMLSDLRHRTKEDAARGRDTRRALDAWGKLLGIRIRGQKVVRQAGRLHAGQMRDAIKSLDGKARDDHSSTLLALDNMSAHLFTLQKRALEAYAETAEATNGLPSLDYLDTCEKQRKRKFDDVEYDTQVSTALRVQEEALGPMWRDVLAKWSWRTSTNSLDDANKARNRFDKSAGSGLKAMNQSAEEQIARGMTGDAYDRLLKRTRVWRGAENEGRIVSDVAKADDDDDEASAQGADSAHDVDIFDDSDFYGTLLRELIDSRGGGAQNGANGTTGYGADDAAAASAEWAQAARRAAKKHRAGLDHRASKGRRLRYDVHEKLENFMPPIPRETWSTEQIDRLVRQLRAGAGLDIVSSEEADKGMAAAQSEDVKLGGLRLFG